MKKGNIDNIEKMVNFDHSVASRLNIKDISKYKTQFDKYKSDFPAAQEAKIFAEKVSTMMGKVSSLGGGGYHYNSSYTDQSILD